MYGMERRESISLRRRLGFRSKGRRCRSLSCGESIVFIITGNMHKRQIPPRSMEQMSKSDPITVAISRNGNHSQIRICELYPCCKRDSSSMQGFCSIAFHILAHFTIAADPSYNHGFMRWDFQLSKGLFKREVNEEISASWASLDLI